MKKLLAFVLLAALACSDPHNQPLPIDLKTATEDPKFKATIEKLPQEERELLVTYFAREMLSKAFGGDPAAAGGAKTIGEAIAEQRKFIEEQKAKETAAKALADKVAAERAATIKAMDDVLTVALTSKKVEPADIYAHRYSDKIAITVAFENKSAKTLTGVKGRLIFSDIFGDVIKHSGLKVDDEIGAGKTYLWEGSMDTNQFIAADTKLANTPQDKLKVSWEPDTYLFSDGTSLKAPQETE